MKKKDEFQVLFPVSPAKGGRQIFATTKVSLVEIHERSHKHSSKYNESRYRCGDEPVPFSALLSQMETSRVEEVLTFNSGARLSVLPHPNNPTVVRIETNSMTSAKLFRLTVYDLYENGTIREISRREHGDLTAFERKNAEIASREIYYVVETNFDP